MFRLLGAVVNFPNVLYMLLFDRESVIRSLEEQRKRPENFDAGLYLDKIVSLQIDLPRITLRSVVKEEFRGLAPVDDDDFCAMLDALVRTPRTALKLADNVRIGKAVNEMCLIEGAPVVDTYMRTELPDFRKVASDRGELDQLIKDAWRYPTLFDLSGVDTRGGRPETAPGQAEGTPNQAGVGFARNGTWQKKVDEIIREVRNESNYVDGNETKSYEQICEGIVECFRRVVETAYADVDDDLKNFFESLRSGSHGILEFKGASDENRKYNKVEQCWLALRAAFMERSCNEQSSVLFKGATPPLIIPKFH